MLVGILSPFREVGSSSHVDDAIQDQKCCDQRQRKGRKYGQRRLYFEACTGVIYVGVQMIGGDLHNVGDTSSYVVYVKTLERADEGSLDDYLSL